MRSAAIRFALNALYLSGAYRLIRRHCEGVGLILTLHHVRPARIDAFQPNRSLEVTPEFLDQVLRLLRRQGFEFISLDELHRRVCAADFTARFACLTFDDGYRDNLQWAYPILKYHRSPFAIFVTSDFADHRGHLWWRTLEQAVAANDHVTLTVDGTPLRFACRTTAEKYSAVRAMDRALSELQNEEKLRAAVEDLAIRTGFDPISHCAAVCMDWKELAGLAKDPLVTIGAHTVTHPRLRRLTPAVARHEMEAGALRIESMLGIRPTHFAYPFGDPTAAGSEEFALAAELGFKTAVTTRPGVLFADAHEKLTCLPRISLNGEYQRARHVQVLASGAATAMWSGLRRLRTA